jgi:hypothetical protein
MTSSCSINKIWCICLRKALQALGSFAGILLLCLPAFSQGSFGRILGTVTDQSGGVVTGATVTVLDKDRGVSRTLTTDDAGAYNAPNLTAGNYTVRAESKGFKIYERTGIVLEVGKEVRVDTTLQPGDQTQTVTTNPSALGVSAFCVSHFCTKRNHGPQKRWLPAFFSFLTGSERTRTVLPRAI